MVKEKTVLVYLFKNDECLLLLRNKKDKDLNKGKYIGIGGKIEEEETKEGALLRETREETGLELMSFNFRGILHFFYDEIIEDIYVFDSYEFNGNLKECNEGTLFWVKKNEVLEKELWEGDRYFLPILLNSNDFFEMELHYKNNILEKVKNIKGE